MKQIYVMLGIVCLFCVPVNAATKCVALDSSKACTGAPALDQINWTMTCGGVAITGVGVCSSTPGSSIGQTADILATESTAGANKYCWCKMTSPAVSRFVFPYDYGAATSCSSGCAYYCVSRAFDNASYRAGLFSNLTN